MKILILGSSGLIGSALRKVLSEGNELEIANSAIADLLDYKQTFDLLASSRPDIILNAAGKVAGIKGQLETPANLIIENAQISLNVAKASNEIHAKKLIQFASACVYPVELNRPALPSDIGNGKVEQTSKSYAKAKEFSIELFDAINSQFDRNWTTIIPSNIYGPFDWGHGNSGHVVSMLSEKFYDAAAKQHDHVKIWGDGTVTRNFLHVDDLAEATKFIIQKDARQQVINVNAIEETSISSLAFTLKELSGFKGEVRFDPSAPTGAIKKSINDNFLRSLGWQEKFSFRSRLSSYYSEFSKYKKGI